LRFRHMKFTDDYNAKYRLWAANSVVVAAPPPVRIPNFKSRRFTSHAELNAWKNSLLRQLAQSSIVK
ncbi:MAG TPA: hypothetical protein VF988_12810, partial [Verrucomicrobiae bacterium]